MLWLFAASTPSAGAWVVDRDDGVVRIDEFGVVARHVLLKDLEGQWSRHVVGHHHVDLGFHVVAGPYVASRFLRQLFPRLFFQSCVVLRDGR